jgi:hypothetical protein
MPSTAQVIYGGSKLQPAYNPESALMLPFNIPASTTIAKGTLVGEVAASLGTVKAYASGNVDGSQIPIGAMAYDVISDASGNITIGGQVGGEFGNTSKDCPVYVTGIFFTADLVGVDANAVTKLGRLLSGSVAAGGVLALAG